MNKSLFKKLYDGEIYPNEDIYSNKPQDKARNANFLYGYRLGMDFAIQAFTNEDLKKSNN